MLSWISWEETEMVRCSDSDDPSEKFENSQVDHGSNVGVALLVPVKKWACLLLDAISRHVN